MLVFVWFAVEIDPKRADLLVGSNRRSRFDRAQSEEGVEDALIDLIQLGLEGIEELV